LSQTEQDRIFNELVTRFYFEFRMKIKGIKITLFDRAHLAVKRSLISSE